MAASASALGLVPPERDILKILGEIMSTEMMPTGLLSVLLMLVVLGVGGCDKGGSSAPSGGGSSSGAPEKPADPLAKLTKTTTNLGQAMFTFEHPVHYALTRLGEGDTATLAWGGNADGQPDIMISRANPAPASLADAVTAASNSGSRTASKQEESADRFVVVAKEPPADGLGGWVAVNVWTRTTTPMLRCLVEIKTTDDNDPRIAQALAWCSSVTPKK